VDSDCYPQAYMGHHKIFTLKVTSDELVLIERTLLGLVPVRQHNDAISLLLQQVRNLRPLPDFTLPTPSSSIHHAGASESLSPSSRRFSTSPSFTRFSTPETRAHTDMTLASPGLPLPMVGDQTLAQVSDLTNQQ